MHVCFAAISLQLNHCTVSSHMAPLMYLLLPPQSTTLPPRVATMPAMCDEGELAALASMFKGNETAATAFCDKLGNRVTGIEEGLNTFFLTIMGALVFIMHAGFAMVSPRHCHSRCFSKECVLPHCLLTGPCCAVPCASPLVL